MEEPFDPMQKVELAMLRVEHQKRFQTQIALIKERVGEGVVYRNDVVTVVVSEAGAYYELIDLPEEFGGASGAHLDRHFLTEAEATALLERTINALPQADVTNTRHVSVLILYTRRGLADRSGPGTTGGPAHPAPALHRQTSVRREWLVVVLDSPRESGRKHLPCPRLGCGAHARLAHCLYPSLEDVCGLELDRGYAPDGVPALLAERLDRGFDLDDLPGLLQLALHRIADDVAGGD